MAEDTDDTILIQGISFPYTTKYNEGHTLNENEADVLNQTLNENLRNNYSGKIKAARKEHNIAEGADLPENILSELRSEFDQYRQDYEFGVRQARAGGGGGDPVRSAALAMARQAIRDALRTNGKKVKDVPSEQIEAAAERLVNDNPTFLEKARAAVEERKANAQAALASLGGSSATDQPAVAA